MCDRYEQCALVQRKKAGSLWRLLLTTPTGWSFLQAGTVVTPHFTFTSMSTVTGNLERWTCPTFWHLFLCTHSRGADWPIAKSRPVQTSACHSQPLRKISVLIILELVCMKTKWWSTLLGLGSPVGSIGRYIVYWATRSIHSLYSLFSLLGILGQKLSIIIDLHSY